MKIRVVNQNACEEHFARATVEWSSFSDESSHFKYLIKFGVHHLISMGYFREAQTLLLNLRFIGKLLNSFDSIEEPSKLVRFFGVDWATQGFVECSQSLPIDPYLEADELVNLKRVSLFLTQMALLTPAVKFLEYIRGASETVYGLNHEHTLIVMNDLGVCYEKLARYSDAEALYERATHLWAAKDVPNIHEMWTLQHNLAAICQAQGNYVEAERYAAEIHQKRSEVNELAHHQSISTSILLASIYRDQRKYIESEKLLLEIVSHYTDDQRQDPQYLIALNDLGLIYKHQERFDEAESKYLLSKKWTEQLYGSNHPSTLTSITNLASLYQQTNRCELAEPLYTVSVAGLIKTLGSKHPRVLTVQRGLGIVYLTLKRYTEAEVLLTDVLHNQEEVLGDDHPDTLISLSYLADIYEHQNRSTEAEQLYIRLVRDSIRVIGEQHPTTYSRIINFGVFYRQQGRYKKAETLYLQALTIAKQIFGFTHHETLIGQMNLGLVYVYQEDYTRAEPYLLNVFTNFEEQFGLDNVRTNYGLNSLTYLYTQQKQYEKLEQLYKRVIQHKQRSLGLENTDTVDAMYQYAKVIFNLQRYEDALVCFQDVLRLETQLYGEAAPDLALTHWNIAKCFRRLLQPSEASVHRRSCWEIECAEDGVSASSTLQTAYALAEDLIACENRMEAHAVIDISLNAVSEELEEDGERDEWADKLRLLK